MAEQIPYGVVERIITSLGSLAFEEIELTLNVKEDLEKLKDTVEFIKSMLMDADQKQQQDHAVKNWISRLRKVVLDADDLLDSFLFEDCRREVNGSGNVVRKVRDFFSSSNQIAFSYKMGHRVKEIQERFNDIAKDMSNLNFSSRNVAIKQKESDWRETSSFVLQSNIIGRDESKEEIIDLLLRSPDNRIVSLIAIVGIGGLGKTTLAQLVYNDDRVVKFFQRLIWICVSEDFEVKSLLKKILESLTKSKVDDLALEVLQDKLREYINGQLYLLVLDDVWNENHEKWNHLRNYLMCGARGSKILVTTRSQMVARTMGVDTTYVLEGLTKEQSWSLLKKFVLQEEAKRMSQNLLPIGEKIAEQCRGVPLAIRTIGSLLQSKLEESEWLTILYGEFWKLSQDNDTIMPVLKLSYDNLSNDLRQCFAYCSLYPKDWKIEKRELIQLWMAQGFIRCSTEQQIMEDLGNQYVKYLLMRSFFQNVEVNEDGDIECFKMHDLMHDLAQSVAGTDYCLHTGGKKITGRPLHISFESEAISFLDLSDANRLKTILWRSIRLIRSINKASIISKLRRLRVLDLSYSSISKLAKSVGQLKHLRYLCLEGCKDLISLPKCTSNLLNLQTLNLNYCVRLEYFPKSITKLINLRHLMIKGCKAFVYRMPIGLRKLTSLQHLSNFNVGLGMRKKAKLNELQELNNLRDDLSIENLASVRDVASESKEVNLKEKKYLQSLELRWNSNLHDFRELLANDKNNDSLQLLDNLCPHPNLKRLTVEMYPGVKFSGWLSSLTNVVKISLIGFPSCRYLPPFEQLPSLRCLLVKNMDALEYIYYECSEGMSPTTSSSLTLAVSIFFPSLETLKLKNCPNLRGWQSILERDANGIDIEKIQPDFLLPPLLHLSDLSIKDCPKLTCMPTYPQLKRKLHLWSTCIKPLVDTLKLNIAASTATEENEKLYPVAGSLKSSFGPLSKLKFMKIGKIDIEALPKDWMRKLTSLERLCIKRFPKGPPVFQQMQFISALQYLEIRTINNLDLWNEFDSVTSECSVLHSQHTLQTIFIYLCEKVKALPDWICYYTLLRDMKIYYCYDLESLPEAMRQLISLQTLEILCCPLLNERCKREKGADWSIICHIPNIIVDRIRI